MRFKCISFSLSSLPLRKFRHHHSSEPNDWIVFLNSLICVTSSWQFTILTEVKSYDSFIWIACVMLLSGSLSPKWQNPNRRDFWWPRRGYSSHLIPCSFVGAILQLYWITYTFPNTAPPTHSDSHPHTLYSLSLFLESFSPCPVTTLLQALTASVTLSCSAELSELPGAQDSTPLGLTLDTKTHYSRLSPFSDCEFLSGRKCVVFIFVRSGSKYALRRHELYTYTLLNEWTWE